MATATDLFESSDLLFAELSCPPDDPEWGEENHMTRSVIALPAAPVWQVHDGAERQLFNQNNVVFHHVGSEYRRERFRDVGYRCLFLVPAPSLLREAMSEFDPSVLDRSDLRFPASGALDGLTFAMSRMLARLLYRCAVEPDSVREALYHVLRGAVRAAKPDAPSPLGRSEATHRVRREIVEEAKVLLTTRLEEGVSLDDLARRLYTSPYHLARLFRTATGYSVHGYLTHLRLRTALDHIQRRPEAVGRVGVMLGFSSHSHFTTSFRRAFGVTPTGFRSATPWLSPV